MESDEVFEENEVLDIDTDLKYEGENFEDEYDAYEVSESFTTEEAKPSPKARVVDDSPRLAEKLRREKEESERAKMKKEATVQDDSFQINSSLHDDFIISNNSLQYDNDNYDYKYEDTSNNEISKMNTLSPEKMSTPIDFDTNEEEDLDYVKGRQLENIKRRARMKKLSEPRKAPTPPEPNKSKYSVRSTYKKKVIPVASIEDRQIKDVRKAKVYVST
jgi:hypothetical protein